MICAVEAFSICLSQKLPKDDKLLENPEISLIYEEIKSISIDKIEKRDVLNLGVAFILLKQKNFFPISKCCFLCCMRKYTVNTKQEALKTIRYYAFCLLTFLVIIPLCFIALAILKRQSTEKNTPTIIISVIKGIVTLFCQINITTIVKNLQRALPQYKIFPKFFSTKMIMTLFTFQTIILNFASTDTNYNSSEEMALLVLYFLLNIENLFIGMILISIYGKTTQLCIEKYTLLAHKTQNVMNTEMMLTNKEENNLITDNKV